MNSFYELNWFVAQALVVFVGTCFIKSFLIVPGLVFNPSYQWGEPLYMVLSAVEIGYIFYIGGIIQDCVEKELAQFQKDTNELLRKVDSLEQENTEMRSVFRRVMVFTEIDKTVFTQ